MIQDISNDLKAALQMANEGFAVFPIWPNSKLPACSNGCKDATSKGEDVLKLWNGRRNLNLGIEAKRSNLILVDVDDKDGRTGSASLANLEKQFGKIPDTLRAMTPSGGLHLYFKLPKGVQMHNIKDKPLIGPGIEMKADNQYLVLPPSSIDGKSYKWIDSTVPIAECPEWLVRLNHQAVEPIEPIDPAWKSVDESRNTPNSFEYTAREVIDRYNSTNNIADILKLGGYSDTNTKTNYLRHPNGDKQDSVHLLGNNCSYHFGAGDPLGGKGVGKDRSCFFPFNATLALEYNGDFKTAIKATSSRLGMDGRMDCKAGQKPNENKATEKAQDNDDLPQFVVFNELRNVKWLWPGRIPLGKLTMISGEQGQGKSTLIYDIISRLTMGLPFPDGEKTNACKVLILSCEDDKEDSAGPKLVAMGANLLNVRRWKGTFTMDQLNKLELKLKKEPLIKFVLIEPIYEQIKGDTNSITNVTKPLEELQKMAERCGVAIVGIHHFGKGKADNANQKTLGSIGFTSKARATWGVVLKKDDPSIRIFAPGKANVKLTNQALQFRIVDAIIQGPEGEIETARVEWLEEKVETTLDKLLSEGNGQRTWQDATTWLKDYLSEEQDSSDVFTDGEEAGFTKKQIYKAKEALCIKPRKDGLRGGWKWSLSQEPIQETSVKDDDPFDARSI